MACAVRTSSKVGGETSTRSHLQYTKTISGNAATIELLSDPGLEAPTNEPSRPHRVEQVGTCTASTIVTAPRPPQVTDLTQTLPSIDEETVPFAQTHTIPTATFAADVSTNSDHNLEGVNGQQENPLMQTPRERLIRQIQHAAATAVTKISIFSRPPQTFQRAPSKASSHVTPSFTSPSSASEWTADRTSLVTTISGATSSSLASSRTSIEPQSLFVDITSPAIYQLDSKERLFMGKARECPSPATMSREWLTTIRSRLLADLVSVLQTLPRSLPREKTIIEPELCMLGKPLGSSTTVELKPTILLRCGSKRCQKAVMNAIKDLEYLQSFSKRQVIVQRRSPRLASALDEDSSNAFEPTMPDDEDMSVELGITMTDSACGLQVKCQHLGSERNCTLGGLIRIDDKVYGLTTAHTFVYLDDTNSPTTDSDSDTESDVASASSVSTTPTCITPRHSTEIAQSDAPILIHGETSCPSIQRWESATLGPYSYATQRQPLSSNNAYSVSSASDFALIELSEEVGSLTNAYALPGESQNGMEIVTTFGFDSSDSSDMNVSILCSPTDVRQGHLLPGDHLFLDRATVFSTKKIQLRRALQRGSSGAWVVQGSTLVGMIVAIYDDEPYAHMLDITSVCSDIRALLSNEEHIPCIRLSVRGTTIASLPAGNSTNEHLATDSTSDLDRLIHELDADDERRSIWKWTLTWRPAKEGRSAAGSHPERLRFSSGIREQIESIPLRHKIIMGVIGMACFCVHLDNVMFPFIFVSISDSFGALRDLGLYVGLYRLFGNFMRPFYAWAYSRWSLRSTLLAALSVLQAGWLISGFAQNSWTFAFGRALSGIGSVGVMTGASNLAMSLASNHRGANHHTKFMKVLTVMEGISSLIGPFIAGALADLLSWRWCVLLLVGLSTPSCFVLILMHFFWQHLARRETCRAAMKLTVLDICSNILISLCSVSCVVSWPYMALYGWVPSATFMASMICTAVLLVVVIIFYVSRTCTRQSRGKSLVPWWSLGIITGCATVVHTSVYIASLYLPFWYQGTEGTSVTVSAMVLLLAMLPQLGCDIVMRFKPRFWQMPVTPFASMMLIALGLGLLVALPRVTNPYPVLLCIFGLGAGICTSLPTLSMFRGRDADMYNIPSMSEPPRPCHDKRAENTLILQRQVFIFWFLNWRELFMSLGTAAAHLVFLMTLRIELDQVLELDTENLLTGGASALGQSRDAEVRTPVLQARTRAFQSTLACVAVVTVLATLLSAGIWYMSLCRRHTSGVDELLVGQESQNGEKEQLYLFLLDEVWGGQHMVMGLPPLEEEENSEPCYSHSTLTPLLRSRHRSKLQRSVTISR